jgi:hypothetical protein
MNLSSLLSDCDVLSECGEVRDFIGAALTDRIVIRDVYLSDLCLGFIRVVWGWFCGMVSSVGHSSIG